MNVRTYAITSMVLCALVATFVPVEAQKRVRSLGGVPTRVSVKRMARVGPNLKMVGKWTMPLDPHGLLDGGPPWYPIFDCFEAEIASPFAPSEVYAPTTYNSGLGDPMGNRYYYGPGYVNPFYANDMTVHTGYIGASANRMQFAFANPAVDGVSAGSEQMYVIVRNYENFANTVAGLAANTAFTVPLNSTLNPANGEVLDLGVLAWNNTSYNYSTVLLAAGHEFKMPDDGATGSGAYVVIFAKTYNSGTGAYTPSTVAQPMLWVTKPTSNPSTQNANQWDDDNAVDGLLFTTPPNAVSELYDYSTGTLFTATSPPFGGMLAFYSDVVPAFRPTSYIVIQGIENSPLNTVSKLYKNDGVKLGIINDELAPSPEFEASSVSFYLTCTALSFSYESSSSRADMTELVRFYNYSTSQFDTNGSWNRAAPTSDTPRTISITPTPTNYINSTTGAMRVHISQIPSLELDGLDGWGAVFDYVAWNVTP